MSPTFSDLPPEILIDNLLPLLPTADLLRLTRASKYFTSLCSDEMLWKRRLREDFNFDGAGTARQTGWKFIYRGLYKPRVYVWGERANGRLGLKQYPEQTRVGVPFPVQLEMPGTSIVRLIAGGMSFHALDTQGNVHVWGTLDGLTYALVRHGFAEKGKCTPTPLKLQLPNPVRSISCGRLHSCALDNKNKIWTFVNWGRPFRLSSSLLSQPDSEPLQIECGWSFASALMKTGEVLVWWPTRGALAEAINREAERLNAEDIGTAQVTYGIIPCHTWEVAVDPILLPSLPQLPDITESDTDYEKQPPRLIQIGGMDSHLVGLTNYGHVVLFRGLDSEQAIGTRGWEYVCPAQHAWLALADVCATQLPEFSEVSRVRKLATFSEGKVASPETMRITHVSAHFNNFFAFSTGSSSIVLQGSTETTPDSKPVVIPELQHKDIISVEIGDYHKAALAANGKLYTWGQYSHGALGLGDPHSLPVGAPGGFANHGDRESRWAEPRQVMVPTEVRFDHGRKIPKDRFCFSVTAAGWHTGALVIDLEPDENEDDDNIQMKYEELSEGGPRRRPWQDPTTPAANVPHRGAPFIYRIGFAGRGLYRGSAGRGGNPNA
ncbi:SCF-associated factor 1 [Leucoagaricus sp. SymC.cos]|nr:SCF-associated factor 1 [Leucoagaricus sp. SymC.cos]